MFLYMAYTFIFYNWYTRVCFCTWPTHSYFTTGIPGYVSVHGLHIHILQLVYQGMFLYMAYTFIFYNWYTRVCFCTWPIHSYFITGIPGYVSVHGLYIHILQLVYQGMFLYMAYTFIF